MTVSSPPAPSRISAESLFQVVHGVAEGLHELRQLLVLRASRLVLCLGGLVLRLGAQQLRRMARAAARSSRRAPSIALITIPIRMLMIRKPAIST